MLTFAIKKKRTSSIAPKHHAPTVSPMSHSLHLQQAKVRHILRGPTLQPKLTIGRPDDKYEQEADRVADKVMRMPEPELQRQVEPEEEEEETLQAKPLSDLITPLVQRQDESEEEEEPIQTSRVGGSKPEMSPGVEARIQYLRGRGKPLTESDRAFFEPRFGHDFSRVRVHTDARAAETTRAINARAYTLGNDIVFGAGHYAPRTGGGRHLMAHELAHIVQQGKAPNIRRKIDVQNRAVSLNSYLTGKGAFGYNRSGNTYSISGFCTFIQETEILVQMLWSGRSFKVKGSTQADAVKNLDAHVKARKGIVDFAAKRRYTFKAGSKMRMNPTYWVDMGRFWRVKPGVKPMDAYHDLNVHPKKYAIACEAATKITMLAGSGNSPLVKDTGVSNDDWVPGDWGYIKNTKFTGKPVGREGENIIFSTGSMFWGHTTSSNPYRTLCGWIKMVKGWNGGAQLKDYRHRPKNGLL